MIEEQDLHDAADVVGATKSAEDCGIAAEGLRAFCRSSRFVDPQRNELASADFLKGLVYGISVGAVAADQ